MRQSTIRALAVLSAVTVGASGAVTIAAGSPVSAAAPTEHAPPPKHWDKRLEPIAKQVELLRHLNFKHPVKATFLSDKDFRKRAAARSDHQSKDDKRNSARFDAQLRSLGVIDSKVDIHNSYRQLDSEALDSFYDRHTQEMVLRGTSLDVATRVMVANQLTHALQDQWFDLDKLEKQADKTHSRFAAGVLSDGDATRIQDDYADGLTPEDEAAFDAKLSGQDQKQQRAVTDEVPRWPATMFFARFVLGSLMTKAVVSYRGNAAVDRLFRHPSTTDVSFMQPLSLFDRQVTKKVATPKLAKGEKKSGDTDVFGAFPLFLTLASRIDVQPALLAAERWAGDSSVGFRRGKTECVRTSFAGDDDAGTKAIGDALTSWSAAWPEGRAKVAVTPKLAILTSCDPGRVPGAKPRDVAAAMTELGIRNAISLIELNDKGTKQQAKCYGDSIIQNPELLAIFVQANKTRTAVSGSDRDKYEAAVAPCEPPGYYNPDNPPGYH